jgi:hypothetical protein
LAASAAGVGVLALAHPAAGRIIYTPTNVAINDSSHYLVLNAEGVPNFLLSNMFWFGSSASGAAIWVEAANAKTFIETSASNRFQGAAALYGGDKIPAKSHGFKAGGYMLDFWNEWGGRPQGGEGYYGKWRNAENRFLGLKFQIQGKTHYGWARISITNNHSCTAMLTGYAYETVPGKSIIAGKTDQADDSSVPPATLGDLARGAGAYR